MRRFVIALLCALVATAVAVEVAPASAGHAVVAKKKCKKKRAASSAKKKCKKKRAPTTTTPGTGGSTTPPDPCASQSSPCLLSLEAGDLCATSNSFGAVNLDRPAVTDTVVSLVSSDTSKVTVDPSTTVSAGQMRANFMYHGVAEGGPVTITASLNGVDRTALVTVTPASGPC